MKCNECKKTIPRGMFIYGRTCEDCHDAELSRIIEQHPILNPLRVTGKTAPKTDKIE